MFHLNIQGQRNKISDLEILIEQKSPDFVCLSEHWATYDEIEYLKLNNYNLSSCFCRRMLKHGGVSIYSKSGLADIEVIDLDFVNSEKTFEACSIKCDYYKLIIVCVYRTPDSDIYSFVMHFEEMVIAFKNSFFSFKVIVLGDFNVDVIKKDVKFKVLSQLLDSYNLQFIINEPTRITRFSRTCIDNIVINNNVTSYEAGILQSGMSDHDAIFIKLMDEKHNTSKLSEDITCRRFSESGMNMYRSLLDGADWEFLGKYADAEACFCAFHDLLLHYLDICFPKITKKKRDNKSKQWITDAIRQLSQTKRELHLELRMFSGHNLLLNAVRVEYENVCRTLKRLIAKAKESLITDMVGNDRSGRRVWGFINSANSKGKKVTQLKSCQVNGESTKTAYDTACAFNKYVANIRDELHLSSPTASLTGRIGNSFFLNPCDAEEVRIVCLGLRSSRSVGWDEIPTELIKFSADLICGPLALVINLCFQQGIFPNNLKLAKIIPVYKKGAATDLNSYRPIALLPVLSKIFERLIYERLTLYLGKYFLLSDAQYGFIRGKSVNLALFETIDFLLESWNRKDLAVAALFDLTKAFDCVDRALLCHKLEQWGVRGVALRLFKSYLANRMQFVELSGCTGSSRSEILESQHGVPQGSILGPVLFLIYVNDLPESIQNKMIMFADDTNILFGAANYGELAADFRMSVADLSGWFCTNGLQLNLSKTQVIRFGSYGGEFTELLLDSSEPVQLEDNVKFLGLYIDKNLRWTSHVEYLLKKLNKYCYLLWNLAQQAPRQVVLTVYFAYVFSNLNYCIEIWGSSSHLVSLLKLQKRCLRLIAGIGWRESCVPVFKSLGILTVVDMYILACATFIREHPDLFAHDVFQHGYGTRNRRIMVQRRTGLEVCRSNCRNSMIRIFNGIPVHIKNLPIKKFKKELKRYLIGECHYSIEAFLR